MKFKRFSFLFLSVLIISGCSTTASVSGMQSKSIGIAPERIKLLEKDMQDLNSRITALETKLSGCSEANKAVIAGEGWKSLANWRKLKTGMSYNSVEKILGPAHRIDGGRIAYWYYKKNGQVTFVNGEVSHWSEPR